MMLPLRSNEMSALFMGQGVSGGEKKSRDMGRGGGAMRLRRVLVSDSALE
jgi:hypothetical protein